MGRRARDWAWTLTITPTQKLVLLLLAEHANGDNRCWPSLSRIQTRTGLTRRGVQRLLRQLEALGLVRSETGGGRVANTYWLAVSGADDGRGRGAADSPLGRPVGRSEANPGHPNRHGTGDGTDMERSCVPAVRRADEQPAGGGQQAPGFPFPPQPPIPHPAAPADAATTGQEALPQGFAQFWAHYPRKRNKGDALKAWRSLKPTPVLVARMVEAIQQAKASADWRQEGGRFIPYPASWLRGKGWEDEFEVNVVPFPNQPGRGSESQRIQASVAALYEIFGEEHGQEDVSARDGLPDGGLRHGAVEGTGRSLLGSDQVAEERAVYDSSQNRGEPQ